MRVVFCLVAVAALVALAAQPAARQRMSFEVASVRPNRAPVLDKDDSSIAFDPGGTLRTVNYPLRLLILFAYDLQNFQLEAPDWTLSARYDIVARSGAALPPGAASRSSMQMMLRTLLADRFTLAAHTETQQRPLYELVRARRDGPPGSQLRRATGECAARRAAAQASTATTPPGPPGFGGCGSSIRLGRILMGGSPLQTLGDVLSRLSQRVVVDRTGLEGEWDVELTFSPDPSSLQLPPGVPLPPAVTDVDANAPPLFTALEDQLGLKLQPTRGPVQILVVDRVEPPAEN